MSDLIIVSYDNSEKDLSAITSLRKNKDKHEMILGNVGNKADEIYKIISSQTYFDEYTRNLYNKAIDDFVKNLYKIGENRDFDWEDIYELADQLKGGE